MNVMCNVYHPLVNISRDLLSIKDKRTPCKQSCEEKPRLYPCHPPDKPKRTPRSTKCKVFIRLTHSSRSLARKQSRRPNIAYQQLLVGTALFPSCTDPTDSVRCTRVCRRLGSLTCRLRGEGLGRRSGGVRLMEDRGRGVVRRCLWGRAV